LLLGIHKAFLDPLTVLSIASYRFGVEEFGKRCLDLFVDLKELVSVLWTGYAVTMACSRLLYGNWIRSVLWFK
jgi:hypothetical protein